ISIADSLCTSRERARRGKPADLGWHVLVVACISGMKPAATVKDVMRRDLERQPRIKPPHPAPLCRSIAVAVIRSLKMSPTSLRQVPRQPDADPLVALRQQREQHLHFLPALLHI